MKQTRRAILGGAATTAVLLGADAASARAGPATPQTFKFDQANPSMLDTFKFDQPEFAKLHPFATVHTVIQVSENEPPLWTLALNNAQNLLDYLGDDKIRIVVVAYGPGLRMFFANSTVSSRIAAQDAEGVEFDACHNTMENDAKRLGHLPELVPQAVLVPSGVVRILQLEAHGFSYVKP